MAERSEQRTRRVAAPTLAELADAGRANNFDFIRFVAASLVILAHSFPVSYGTSHREILYRMSRGQTHFGSLAVAVFFVISGFLITMSYEHSKGPFDFLVKRALRIFPGLVVVVVLSAFVLGALVTELPVREYFAHPQTYGYLENALLRAFQTGLPGVFLDLPLPVLVNGSLWTLWYEFLCYLAILALGVAQLLRPAVLLTLLAFALVGYRLVPPLAEYALYFKFFAFFAGGALAYLLRRRLTLTTGSAVGSLVLLAITMRVGGFNVAFAIAGSYLTLFVAFAPWLPATRFAKHGDFSYGLYLYAFPIQQIVSMLFLPNVSWWKNLLVAYPFALACAAASWHLVERPALSLKGRFLRRAHATRAAE